jgi:hypothetical protein
MKTEIIDGRLLVSAKLRKPGPSNSGRTLSVATRREPQYSDIRIMGKLFHISLNAFIDTPETKRRVEKCAA